LNSNEQDRIECNIGFCKALGADCNLFLASYANTFTSLSPVSGNQVQMNHLIKFEEPMNKPTHKTPCRPTNELLIDLWKCQLEIDEMNSKKETQPRGLFQDKNQNK
jgi:hypothetical protein